MFEVGFSELMLIMVVALLVIGPERLPKVARNVGRWVGKARSMLRTVKAEISRELAAEELQRVLKSQANSTDPFEMIEKIAPSTPTSDATQATPQDKTPANTGTHDGQS